RRTGPVNERPNFFNEIGGIGSHRPFMTVRRDFAVAVKIVQEHELTRQPVVVRRDLLGENTEARIAVAFRHIAEKLVVRAVLLDDSPAMTSPCHWLHRSAYPPG